MIVPPTSAGLFANASLLHPHQGKARSDIRPLRRDYSSPDDECDVDSDPNPENCHARSSLEHERR